MGSYTMMDPPEREEGDSGVKPDHDPSEHDPSTQIPLKNPSPDRDIPIRLKALRMSLGLSAAKMDRQSGFTIGTIGRLERGDLRVYANHLYRVSSATGIAISYFYEQLDGVRGGFSAVWTGSRRLKFPPVRTHRVSMSDL